MLPPGQSPHSSWGPYTLQVARIVSPCVISFSNSRITERGSQCSSRNHSSSSSPRKWSCADANRAPFPEWPRCACRSWMNGRKANMCRHAEMANARRHGRSAGSAMSSAATTPMAHATSTLKDLSEGRARKQATKSAVLQSKSMWRCSRVHGERARNGRRVEVLPLCSSSRRRPGRVRE